MKCPIDGADLHLSERQGIEIDYCPSCRGVWLDRGELDKIIERSAQIGAPPAQPTAVAPAPPVRPQPDYRRDYDDDDDDDRYRRDDGYKKRKKKGGFLGELFDFD